MSHTRSIPALTLAGAKAMLAAAAAEGLENGWSVSIAVAARDEQVAHAGLATFVR